MRALVLVVGLFASSAAFADDLGDCLKTCEDIVKTCADSCAKKAKGAAGQCKAQCSPVGDACKKDCKDNAAPPPSKEGAQ